MTVTLAERDPVIPPENLVALLRPPPRFSSVRFENYIPDAAHPSQAAAVAAGEEFAERPPTRKRKLFRANTPEQRPGIYFDGGFGVGKTHLLAALWHADPGTKVFGTFVEYTNLVGALGFADAVAQLSTHGLVCIDEFELDDPGESQVTAGQKNIPIFVRVGSQRGQHVLLFLFVSGHGGAIFVF